jgi:hypothetical protein
VRTLILIMSRGGGVSAVKFKPNMPKVASGDVRFTPLLENAEIAQTRLAHAIGRHDTVNRRCVVAELIFHHVPLWPGTTGRPRAIFWQVQVGPLVTSAPQNLVPSAASMAFNASFIGPKIISTAARLGRGYKDV